MVGRLTARCARLSLALAAALAMTFGAVGSAAAHDTSYCDHKNRHGDLWILWWMGGFNDPTGHYHRYDHEYSGQIVHSEVNKCHNHSGSAPALMVELVGKVLRAGV